MIRVVQPSDLPSLIDLFDRAYGVYAGYAERSVEDFGWRYLDRPDIGADGVIVVEDAQLRLLGYVVVGKTGTIWEFAIDPDADRPVVAALLFAEAERLLMDQGVDEIMLHAPVDDSDVAGALKVAGYGGRPAIQQYLSFVDLPGAVERTLAKHRDAVPRGVGAVEFVIENPRAWHPKQFRVRLTDKETASSSTVTLSASVESLVGVMVGSLGPVQAVAGRLVRIAPLSKTGAGLRILQAMPFATASSSPLPTLYELLVPRLNRRIRSRSQNRS